jgi:hypothetical protein
MLVIYFWGGLGSLIERNTMTILKTLYSFELNDVKITLGPSTLGHTVEN